MTNPYAMIIDDNETGIKVLSEMLSAVGINYVAIQDPTDLEGKLDELSQVDVIFLDLEMPKIDGYEMFRILKDELHLACPIIAYSVNTSEISTARDMGFDGFLGKPLRMNRFPGQVERILNGEPVWEID
jgi:CheY-like chemotaxis protein